MRFSLGDFAFDLEDEWWAAARMEPWKPPSASYHFDLSKFPAAREVRIADIAPVRRALSHGVFNNDAETELPARERVIRILTAFREEIPLPPVEVAKAIDGETHAYCLVHGAHRFYLSAAAGFTHIPAVVARQW